MLVSRRLPRVERKSAFSAPSGQLGPAVAEVETEAVRGLLAERHDALLAALAADVHRLAVEVDVPEVEPHRLVAAEARRVDELDQRPVP